MIKLKGTFLDEITHDIPSQNWTADDWEKDFRAMKDVGIDTVILIRAGYKQQAALPSAVLKNEMNIFPVYTDLMDLFLTLAETHEMDFYFGLYDSGRYWMEGNYRKEVDINKAFCEEVVKIYGDRKAFSGWYISHELTRFNEGLMTLYRELSGWLKELKDQPTLISPYVSGVKQFGENAISFEEHTREWEQIFTHLDGTVDIVAFQDGQVGYDELTDYLVAHRELAESHGIESWSNVESFDRDMPIKFPPIPFKNLRYKMEQAHKAGIENMITFEFSHFMSPNSIYKSAHGLYRQYSAWLREQGLGNS